VKAVPLVDAQKVLLPPLHIKLGLMKTFVKNLDRNGAAFQYLAEKFPEISETKMKEGIFIGPQIRQLIRDREFLSRMASVELQLGILSLKLWVTFWETTSWTIMKILLDR